VDQNEQQALDHNALAEDEEPEAEKVEAARHVLVEILQGKLPGQHAHGAVDEQSFIDIDLEAFIVGQVIDQTDQNDQQTDNEGKIASSFGRIGHRVSLR